MTSYSGIEVPFVGDVKNDFLENGGLGIIGKNLDDFIPIIEKEIALT